MSEVMGYTRECCVFCVVLCHVVGQGVPFFVPCVCCGLRGIFVLS